MNPNPTQREIEVLRLLCGNYTNQGVAAHLGISPKTVEKHRNNLCRITGSNSIVGLLRYALQHRIVDIEAWLTRPLDAKMRPRMRRNRI